MSMSLESAARPLHSVSSLSSTYLPAIVVPLVFSAALSEPHSPVVWLLIALAIVVISVAAFPQIMGTGAAPDYDRPQLAPGTAVTVAVVVTIVSSIAVQWCQDLTIRSQGFELAHDIAVFSRDFRARQPNYPTFPRPPEFNTARQFRQERAYFAAVDRYYYQENSEYRQRFASRLHMFCDEARTRRIDSGDSVLGAICLDPSRSYLLEWRADSIAAAANRLPQPSGWFNRRWALSTAVSAVLAALVLGLMEHALGRYRAQLLDADQESRTQTLR
jgi:hypothetical protein